jgi:hypothetical protein
MHRPYNAPRFESAPPPTLTAEEQIDPPLEEATEVPTPTAEVAEVVDPPELTAAEQQDQETRYQDVELLGHRYSVLRAINENTVQALQKGQESIRAKYHNTLDTPGLWGRQFAHSLAESSVSRKQAKYDEVAHLGDNSFLKKRRLARLQKAERRRDGTKQRLDERTARMEGRTKSVEDNAERRRNEYIAELKSKRDAAMGRKALRHELRAQGAGRLEARSITKEIVSSMPKEHLARVGDLASRAYAGERFSRQADRSEAQAARREQDITQRINRNAERQEQYANEAKEAHKTVREIRETHLPAAEQRVTELRSELADMSVDDPTYNDIAAQLNNAEERVKIYTERELPYWEATAKQNEEYVIKLGAQREDLKRQRVAQKESVAARSETAGQKRTVAEQHQATASEAAQRIINGETETGE